MAAIDPALTDDRPPAQPEYADPVDGKHVDAPIGEGSAGPDRDEATLPPLTDPDGELEALEDRSAPVERLLWAEDREGARVERIYMQKGLSWFGKLELYGLLGEAIKIVLEGENPLGVGSIVDMARDPRKMVSDLLGDMPGAADAPDMEGDSDPELEAGKVLAAFAKVVAISPDLLKQAYCVVLAIPKTHRTWAVEWAFPNMDDEMGQDVLHTFVDQNWGVMEDFFARELPRIMKRIVKARQASAGPR